MCVYVCAGCLGAKGCSFCGGGSVPASCGYPGSGGPASQVATWQRQHCCSSAQPGIPAAAPAENAGQQGPTLNGCTEARGETLKMVFTGIKWESSWFCNTARRVCLELCGVEPSNTCAAWIPGQPLSSPAGISDLYPVHSTQALCIIRVCCLCG